MLYKSEESHNIPEKYLTGNEYYQECIITIGSWSYRFIIVILSSYWWYAFTAIRPTSWSDILIDCCPLNLSYRISALPSATRYLETPNTTTANMTCGRGVWRFLLASLVCVPALKSCWCHMSVLQRLLSSSGVWRLVVQTLHRCKYRPNSQYQVYGLILGQNWKYAVLILYWHNSLNIID